MAFLSSFDICASGLSAQRLRMDIAAENIVNIDTTRTQGGDISLIGPGCGHTVHSLFQQIHIIPGIRVQQETV